ncbi:MAG: hypothetical protein JXL20_01930, partial [Deltaproteobacteria bacterium]|nr:hypothetical protein [Deltaproteobacteria bacterium]
PDDGLGLRRLPGQNGRHPTLMTFSAESFRRGVGVRPSRECFSGSLSTFKLLTFNSNLTAA